MRTPMSSGPLTLSERPVPRLSKWMTRMLRARRCMRRAKRGPLPVDLHVRAPGVDDDEGERPRAEVLVGDRSPVDGLRPADFGDLAHRRPPFVA